ncbi:MAG: NAD(+) synthase [Oscillibacter sp.]|nr:NAD(+) synthase [Oscillibacter sp.]
MKDGFLSAACGTPDVRPADCHYNAEQTFTIMRKADKAGARVLVLPELGLTGATCGDLFFQDALLKGAEEALATVLEATRHLEVVTAVGLPLRVRGRLYDCAAVIQKGKILGLVPRAELSDAESRYFTPAPDTPCTVDFPGQSGIPFGAGLIFPCETLPGLTVGFEFGGDLAGLEPPSVSMARGGATVVGCLDAAPTVIGMDDRCRQFVTSQSLRLVCGYLYAGAGEGESVADSVYGAHQLISENGALLAERRFDGGLLVSEIDLGRLSYERRRHWRNTAPSDARRAGSFALTLTETRLTRYLPSMPFVPESPAELRERCREILLTAALGLKRRLQDTNSKAAVIGLSGGLDSTLAVLITARAMELLGRPASDIVAVTMPGFGTTDGTKDNAVKLAECLGVTLRTVRISSSVLAHFRDIGHDPDLHNVTYENAQARERTQVLMDIANDLGGLVVGTGDLSELALGWCTYNGDHMSMYAVNASIPKTLIRHIVACVAEETPELSDVLRGVLETPVSPELLPAVQGEIAQKTEDLVGPYELHDFFLYYMVRWGFTPSKILRLAVEAFGDRYARDIILKWLRVFYRRFFSQQFKRDCVPDGPKVGKVSLSPRGDWRMPSDASLALWRAELETL